MNKAVILLLILGIVPGVWAEDFFNPPPLNPDAPPPWMQNQPAQPSSPPPSDFPSDSGFPPPPPPDAGGFPPMPEDDFGGFDSGFGMEPRGPSSEGKSSFQIVEGDAATPTPGQDCEGWGSSFIGAKVFPSEEACKTQLSEDIENAKDKVHNYTDQTEKTVLRAVIQGKLSREKSRDFQIDFPDLRSTLIFAARSGCTCLE